MSSQLLGIGGRFDDELADLEDECFDFFSACGEASSGDGELDAGGLAVFGFFLAGEGSGDEERDAGAGPLDGFFFFFFGAGDAAGDSRFSASLDEGTRSTSSSSSGGGARAVRLASRRARSPAAWVCAWSTYRQEGRERKWRGRE